MRLTTQVLTFEDKENEVEVDIKCNICWTPLADYGGWVPISCVPSEDTDLKEWGTACFFETPHTPLENTFHEWWDDEYLTYPSRVPLNECHQPPIGNEHY
jgi:hypothetical protein